MDISETRTYYHTFFIKNFNKSILGNKAKKIKNFGF